MGIINQNVQTQGMDPATRQKTTQKIVMAAISVLNDGQMEQQILQLVKSGSSPADGLAKATIALMEALYEKSKGTMPMAASLPAMRGVMGEIAKMAEAAGILKMTPQIIKDALAQVLQTATQGQGQAAPAAPAAAQPAPAQPMMGA